MKFISLDSLCSWESISVHFNTTEVVTREENHFEDDRNIKYAQLNRIMSDLKMARETKIHRFRLLCFKFKQWRNLNCLKHWIRSRISWKFTCKGCKEMT